LRDVSTAARETSNVTEHMAVHGAEFCYCLHPQAGIP
jgi:hypothetical protein